MQKRIFLKSGKVKSEEIDELSDNYQLLEIPELINLTCNKIIDGVLYSSSQDLVEMIDVAVNNPLVLAANHLIDEIELMQDVEMKNYCKHIVLEISAIIPKLNTNIRTH